MSKKKKIHYDMNSKKTDLNDSNHPLRIMANRIIEEVVEFHAEISASSKIRMSDDIVALLSNLE